MTSTFEEKKENKSQIFDLLIVLDASGSMKSMGDEPIQAINIYIEEFKKTADKTATVTFVTFNLLSQTHFKDLSIEKVDTIPTDIYKTWGGTSLNDTVCSTINTTLESSKPNNKIMLIITDGLDNNSFKYKKVDAKNLIEMVESKYDWQVIFLGANIDSFEESMSLNISHHRTGQFDQTHIGNLIELCRSSGEATSHFTRSRSEGFTDVKLTFQQFENIDSCITNKYCNFIPFPPTPLTRESTYI